jgi:hypothetical protein
MLLTALGLALVVAAALFVAWPMLTSAGDAPAGDADGAAPGERVDPLGAFERQRDAALGALKEAEFDHQVGKLSDGDYAVLRSELEAHALAALAALDAARAEAEAATSAAATGRGGGSFCAACGRQNATSKGFCAGCGKRLTPAVERPRRRA